MAIRVLLVDDQSMIRAGLRAVLSHEPDIDIVGEAEHGDAAVEQTALTSPDLVLMDVMMPRRDGIAATRIIRQQHPSSRVLILTAHADHDLFRQAAQAGAVGFVLKDIAPQHLVAAIRAIHKGSTMLSPAIARQMLDYLYTTRYDAPTSATARLWGLTPRDVEVLSYLVDGLRDKEIGAKLFLSEATVKTHLRGIYRHLKVSNRAQAVAVAIENKLIPSARTILATDLADDRAVAQ